MSDIIDSVASLIDVRDRDDLEITLASVMFELVEAAELELWRRTGRGEVLGFRRRFVRTARPAVSAASSPFRAGRALALNEMSEEARAAFASRQCIQGEPGDGALSRHAFPVMDGNVVVGLIEIVRAPPLGRDGERLVLGLMRIYRSHLGILDHSETDELTGLCNRRPFDETFRRLANANAPPGLHAGTPAGRATAPRCAELAIADIDFFKRVNDNYGHPFGDEVLVLFSRLMRESFRDEDRLFRFGGEEFVIILPDLHPADAERALERFREAVFNFDFPQVGRVSVSLGVTSIRAGETGSDAYGRADEALYRAKRQGRNRVLRWETLVEDGVIAPRAARQADVEMF